MQWRGMLERDPETGNWAAWVPELPGCASCAETEDEAMANLQEAIELYQDEGTGDTHAPRAVAH